MKETFLLIELDDTKKLAKRIAGLCKPGTTVLLFGDLGTGKTTLTKFIGEALGENPENISSPTFALIHEYDTSPPMAHVDLYRLGRGDHIFSLGLHEYLERGFILVIEWAQYLTDMNELDRRIEVYIDFKNNERVAFIC